MASRSSAQFSEPAVETPTHDFQFEEPQIKAVSFSRMAVYEQCPYRAYLAFAKRIPENPPESKTETPLNRGSRVHDAAEGYVRGVKPLIQELQSFQAELYDLHQRFLQKPDTIALEQMWCYDSSWSPVASNDWDNIWGRVKQDAVVFPTPESVIAIDYKTGKKVGNEVKHNTQLRIGLLGTMFKYPEIEEFTAENWYTDQDQIVTQQYTKQDIQDSFEELDGRLRAVTSETNYVPAPSSNNCRFCPYKSGKVGKYQTGTGDCPYAA